MLPPLRLGLPPTPLPEGWAERIPLVKKRLARVIRRVTDIEQEGNPRVYLQRNPKGYLVVYLGRYHPYARRNGLQLLHRWIAMRTVGRVLEPYEHVHHKEGAPKDSTDYADLVIMQDVDHGQHHYGTHFIRSSLGTLIWVGCRNNCKTEEELRCLTPTSTEG